MGAKPRAFKHQLGPERVRQIADALAAAQPAINRDGFVRGALAGLEELELKARVRHIIAEFHRVLPQPFPRAAAVLVRAVESDTELRGFAAWPLIDYVGDYGLDHVEVALATLRALTERFSAEFAIRPFLAEHQSQTLAEIATWTDDNSEHVRRLVSEGTRPLLPWGMRLAAFRADPSLVIELLEKLKADPSEYVRRSVANNLNDVAKDHPERVVDVCRAWWLDGDIDRERLIKRALRTLIKRGDRDALALLGFGEAAVEVGEFSLDPKSLREGDSVELNFELTSTSDAGQSLNIDYAVHFVKANGERSPKVFKLKTLQLPPRASESVRKSHSMKAVTTRVHYPGIHKIELLINGHSMGSRDFVLEA